jgi:hypothetical protein
MAKTEKKIFKGSLFEEDYLVRTLGLLATSPETALTELVANAWDAGATDVQIYIPDEYGGKLSIIDNGTGLTKEQFLSRWMKLGYNRLRHQGEKVIFPKGITGNRLAYGRNGVGRHGLLCFNNEYIVITEAGGMRSTFTVTTIDETHPFSVKDSHFEVSRKHGTRLEVIVNRNLPRTERILDIISSRFLHDPSFKISINRKTVKLEELSGLIDTRELDVDGIKLKMHFVDTLKAGRTTLYQGIAFWQAGRLVGEPSWILGRHFYVDGRTREAKRYNVVVSSNDLSDFIFEDWTGFKDIEQMDKIYIAVGAYVNEMIAKQAKENISETTRTIKEEFAEEYSKLSPLAKFEVEEAIASIAVTNPTAKSESVSLAVQTLIHLEKTRSGKQLLAKLSMLTPDDIEGLDRLLSNWSIRDALTVLDEIDNRISVIEAIRKLLADPTVDELHVLHPLITAARWLFGPEFESAEYSSNRQLHTAANVIFKKKVSKEVFNNAKKRPDIIVLPKSTISVTGIESFNEDDSLVFVNKILIIELKRGEFKLTKEERNQAQGYAEEFINTGSLIGSPYVDAFVVGNSYSEKMQPITTIKNDQEIEKGKVRVTLFSQLVSTAEKRLFGLREKLTERYEDIPGMKLFMQVTETQMDIPF